MPCAIRSMRSSPSATWPRSDSATPTIAALPRFRPSITRPPPGRTRDRAAPRRRAMHAEADAHADLHLHRVDVLDPAHQAEAFVAVDQRDVVGLALGRMHDGGRVDRAEPLADPPFELAAAGERADHARVEHRLARLGAELIGELALLEVLEIGLERRLLCVPAWSARPPWHAASGMLAPGGTADQPRFVSLRSPATIGERTCPARSRSCHEAVLVVAVAVRAQGDGDGA